MRHPRTAVYAHFRIGPHLKKGGIFQALELLDQAIEHDPHYGPALALAASSRQLLEANNWTDDPETNRRKGINLALQALRFAPDDPEVLAVSGFALGLFGEDINAAIRLIERSLILNPSFARGWQLSGVLRVMAGQSDLAIEHFKTSSRLSPRDRTGKGAALGAAHFFCRRFDDAAATLLSSLQEAPGWPVPYRLLASCYAHMGRLDEAREIVNRLREITPVVIPNVIPYRNPEDRELFLSGLRLAAGEEA